MKHASIEGRQARIFAADDAEATALVPPEREVLDVQDLAREVPLRERLQRPAVRITGHPGNDPPDAWDVYLESSLGPSTPEQPPPLFCFVLATEECVERVLLGQLREPRVVEGFCLQVVPGSSITDHVVAAAFETWMQRNFSELRRPVVHVDVWTEADDEGQEEDRFAGLAELLGSFDDDDDDRVRRGIVPEAQQAEDVAA